MKTALAAQTIAPKDMAQLSHSDVNYNVALFHYFNNDYQQALKELALINQFEFTKQQQTAHQNFKHILLLSSGEVLSPDLISIEQDDAVIQAVMIAVKQQIKLGRWTQAARLFNVLPEVMEQRLLNQRNYLKAYLALHQKTDKTFLESAQKLDKHSQEFALLLQHEAVSPLIHTSGDYDTVKQLRTIDNAALEDIKNSGFLAQGYRYLADGEPENAARAFEHISLNSLNNNEASLGLGIALNQLQSFARAKVLFKRVLDSGDPGVLFFEATLGYAFALEQLGNEEEAYQQLTTALNLAAERIIKLPRLQAHLLKQKQCIINLIDNARLNNCDLKGEELNEQFISLLSSQSFLEISKQIHSLSQLSMQYEQQRQSVSSFEFLLSHQMTMISKLLNDTKIKQLESEIEKLAAQRTVVVEDVDGAEAKHDGHFFLSSQYLALQKRIDEVFKRMVFLKRAGQKNMASERRITLMQRIVWWHSFSEFTQHVTDTRQYIDELNHQLTTNKNDYQTLQDYLKKVPVMTTQLAEVERIHKHILEQEKHVPGIKKNIYAQINTLFSQFSQQQKSELDTFILHAELARVRMADASFNRAQALEEGIE